MELITPRLRIRDYRAEDLDDLYEIFSDPETMRDCEPACSEAQVRDYLALFMDKSIAYAVELRETGKVIGHALFKQLPGEEDGIYEIGWIYNRAYWRQGYAYEAARALIDYGFETLRVHKVCAETLNPVRSGGLARKLGMIEEGHFRAHTLDNDGNWADFYWYAVVN